MSVEFLTEIMPGLAISLGCLLLWWQAHADLRALRREWKAKISELAEADSWAEASELLKNYAGQSDA